MKLAIHNRPGGFADRWIRYCTERGIEYKIVNCYDSDILNQLKEVDGLLWHWEFMEPNAQLVAKQIITSVEKMGIRVFPNITTCWHYDDKIGQKYLLEAIQAPLVPSYVFFDKQEAMDWIDKTEFPKVFKLRCGAGSQNVKLVKTKREAKALCEKAFGKGFTAIGGYFRDAKTKARKVKNINQLRNKLSRMSKVIHDISSKKHFLPKQRGYIYFQEFLPDNKFDTRITVIGNRAFGYIRKTRPNDFRASGSGQVIYDMDRIDQRCIQIAFRVVSKLKTQSLAFDFIFDQYNEPRITEISYCYISKYVYTCPGYWDDKLNRHEGNIWPEDAILEDLIKELNSK